MVCDFFYPNVGGVESHIYQLSQCLMNRGHKVVIVTHSYNDRTGVRYMTNGMKIYYLPLYVVYNQCSLPTLFTTFPILRYILIREQINIVHGHSAFSALALETIIHARILGIKTVFTDHSLFGFSDASAIITNILLSMTLSLCNRVICVSHTGKENTALRANVKPETIYVIPNAVDNDIFVPDFNKIPNRSKSIDLLGKLIPIICGLYPNTEFIIGGDGPKRAMLNDVVKQNKLEDRVQLLGAVKYDQVRNILIKGDIFLNSSLTEAFCIAIVEAVSCGLQVVTTNVGGIPEVLPSDLIWLGEPTVQGLVGALEKAIQDRKLGNVVCPLEAHNRIRKYYQWPDIAKRTEVIYDSLIDKTDNLIDKTSIYRNGLNESKSPGIRKRRFKVVDDENDFNRVNMNNNLNGLNNNTNGRFKDSNLISHHQTNSQLNNLNGLTKPNQIDTKRINKNSTAMKVLFENQIQYIDLDYLKSNQDKPGLKQLIKQCLNSNWFFGTFLLFLLYVEFLMKVFYDWWSPKSQIDICPTTITIPPNQIRNRIEENNNSVLKISNHQYTNSCTNCDLYVESIDYSINSLMKSRELQQLLKSTNSFSLRNYLTSLNSTTNSGLRTIELMDHKFDIHYNDDHETEDQRIMKQCRQIKAKSTKRNDNLTSGRSTRFDYDLEDEELNERSTEELTEDSFDGSFEDSLGDSLGDSLENSSEDNRQTIQFDDDEQDKNSTTESTSGYNTSNSVDSDLNSDNNSTGSNCDLGEHLPSTVYVLDSGRIVIDDHDQLNQSTSHLANACLNEHLSKHQIKQKKKKSAINNLTSLLGSRVSTRYIRMKPKIHSL